MMPIILKNKVGEGAYADVWLATDELDREVAVKVIRQSMLGYVDALAHARALARVDHPNVVRVHKLDRIQDPETKVETDCVVMELIRGETMRDYLKGHFLTVAELQLFGAGLIDGIASIHTAGIPHGDLHSENIMVFAGGLKIIDILYRDSLTLLSTMRREDRLRQDVRALRLLLQELIHHSELDPDEANEFNQQLGLDPSLKDVRTAFLGVLTPQVATDDVRHLDNVYRRFEDEGFVDSQEYADALAEKTAQRLTLPLLERVIREKAYQPRHARYIRSLWQRLDTTRKADFAEKVDALLESDLPKGKWWPTLQLTTAIGDPIWKLLSRLTKLRIQELIANDILAGYVDIYGNGDGSKGALGTYATSLWPLFTSNTQGRVADNIIAMLKQGWYTQNYIGRSLLHVVAPIAEHTGKKEEMLGAVIDAVNNDARIVKNNLTKLPTDWQAAIAEATAPPKRTKRPADDFDDDIPF